MSHSFTSKGNKRYRYYACTKAVASGRKTCPSGSLPAAEIERVVFEQIRDISTDPGLREEVLHQAQKQQENVDTKHFPADFTARLLEALGNLDEKTDGVLLHSENFQALSLMQARYREKVKCVSK